MARDGSGNYSLPTGNPVVTGTSISSTTHNTTMADVASALTASIAKDGQTTPTANLPMGGYKHTGVADATARTQYATAGQVQDNVLDWLTSVSGTDTITANAAVSMSAYAAGQTFRFTAAGANTGATTLNINSIGTKSITKSGTTALSAGDIQSGATVVVVYDGTRFQMVNPYIPADPELSALAGLTSAANKVPMFSGSGTASLLDFKDEDDMASDSATAVPSQQSTKAYADSVAASAQSAAESYADAAVAANPSAFTGKYTSSATAITLGGLLTFAHSLGAVPFGVQLMLENVTGEGGYTTGDQIFIGPSFQNQSAGGGQAVYADSTNVYVRVSTAVYQAHNKTTGAPFNLTTASWKLIVKAWA